jgi:dipeptide/tripeptide permease
MTGMLVLTTAIALLLQVTNVAEVFLVRDTLDASATMFGLIGGCWMAGMFAGSWLVGLAARGDGGLLRWGLGAAGLQAAAITAVAVAPTAWWLMPLFAIGGVGNGAVNVSRQTLVGRRAPEHARGRIFSVVSAVSNLGSVVALGIGGVIVGAVEPRWVYAVCGALCLLATAGYAAPMLRVARAVEEPRVSRAPLPARTTAASTASGTPFARGRHDGAADLEPSHSAASAPATYARQREQRRSAPSPGRSHPVPELPADLLGAGPHGRAARRRVDQGHPGQPE